MTIACSLPALYSCGHKLDSEDSCLGLLESTCTATSAHERLQQCMADDGYVFLRGCLNREEVLAARHHTLELLAAEGSLDPSAPLTDGRTKPGVSLQFRGDLAQKNNPPLQHLLYAPQGNLMRFFSTFLNGEVLHYDFTWLRCIPPGPATPSHCDIVYMGRGTRKLYTAWVPLGDLDFEMGGLMVLEGSHKNQRLQNTYGQRDVDLYCSNRPDDIARTAKGSNGWLSEDPNQIRRSLGRRWLTTEYRAGDVVVFNMDLVHAGIDNRSDRFRISSDSRYQLASEPVDERWVGENPAGHGLAGKRGRIC